MEDLYSEFDLDMTKVCPQVTHATREAPGEEPGAGAGGCGGQPPDTIGLPREGQFR